MGKRSPGRPTKLTSEVRAEICTLLQQGVRPVERAVELAGIGTRTYYTWMSSTDPRCRQFQLAVRLALGHGVKRATGVVYDLLDSPDERVRLAAAKEVLRWDEAYTPRQRIEATGKDGGPIPVEVAGTVAVRPVFTDEQLAALSAEQLEAALGALLNARGAA